MWILLMWKELEIENIILILILYKTLGWEYIWLYSVLFMVNVDIINWIIIMMISYLITLKSILS